MSKEYYDRDLHFQNILHKRTAWQYDPKLGRLVQLSFYLRAKKGKLNVDDKIFLIGILNEETGNYEEYALTEDEPLDIIEHIFANDFRLDSQTRLMKKIDLLMLKLKRLFEQKTGQKWEIKI